MNRNPICPDRLQAYAETLENPEERTLIEACAWQWRSIIDHGAEEWGKQFEALAIKAEVERLRLMGQSWNLVDDLAAEGKAPETVDPEQPMRSILRKKLSDAVRERDGARADARQLIREAIQREDLHARMIERMTAKATAAPASPPVYVTDCEGLLNHFRDEVDRAGACDPFTERFAEIFRGVFKHHTRAADVERVAKAICEAIRAHYAQWPSAYISDWEGLLARGREEWRIVARAALSALSVPITEAKHTGTGAPVQTQHPRETHEHADGRSDRDDRRASASRGTPQGGSARWQAADEREDRSDGRIPRAESAGSVGGARMSPPGLGAGEVDRGRDEHGGGSAMRREGEDGAARRADVARQGDHEAVVLLTDARAGCEPAAAPSETRAGETPSAWKAPWFSYSSLESFESHATAEEARAKAQESLDYCRDEAGDGWPEEVTSICWGRVYGEVQETERRKRTDEDVMVAATCEGIVEYALLGDPALAHLALAAPQDDESPGDMIAAQADGTITLDDGITTHSYRRACAFFAAEVARLAAPSGEAKPKYPYQTPTNASGVLNVQPPASPPGAQRECAIDTTAVATMAVERAWVYVVDIDGCTPEVREALIPRLAAELAEALASPQSAPGGAQTVTPPPYADWIYENEAAIQAVSERDAQWLATLGQPRAEAACRHEVIDVETQACDDCGEPAPASAPGFALNRERMVQAVLRVASIAGSTTGQIADAAIEEAERQLRAQNTSAGAVVGSEGVCPKDPGSSTAPVSTAREKWPAERRADAVEVLGSGNRMTPEWDGLDHACAAIARVAPAFVEPIAVPAGYLIKVPGYDLPFRHIDVVTHAEWVKALRARGLRVAAEGSAAT